MQRIQRILTLVILIGLLCGVSACARPDPADTAQDIGLNRVTPHPYATEAILEGWKIQALETIRGTEAWEILQEANFFNEPPPEGWEYLMVKLRVECTIVTPGNHDLRFGVTGDHARFYSPYAAVAPDPRLPSPFGALESATGRHVFLVQEDEGNLMLAAKNDQHDAPYHYLALEEGARILVDLGMNSSQPTQVGYSLKEPVPFGKTVTTEDWELTVEEVVWGDSALQLLQEANKYNDPPAPDMQHVLVKLRVHYIGILEGPVFISTSRFGLVGVDNAYYDEPSLVEPEPELWAALYPDGTVTGWVALEVDSSTEDPLLSFQATYMPDERRYLSLRP